jgi:hypothetical protein
MGTGRSLQDRMAEKVNHPTLKKDNRKTVKASWMSGRKKEG